MESVDVGRRWRTRFIAQQRQNDESGRTRARAAMDVLCDVRRFLDVSNR
jgi:hypothetical protein